MQTSTQQVTTVAELLAATQNPQVARIQLAASLSNVPSVRLLPGQTLSAADAQTAIRFASGEDGLQLSADNQVEHLSLITDPERRAIFNDTTVAHLGRLTLRRLSITGVVQLLARDRVGGGHVVAHDINIAAADARGYVRVPNVDSLVETMDMREAQRTYAANLSVLEVTRGMLTRTIEALRA